MKKNTILSMLAAAAFVASVPSCTDLDERIFDKMPADSFGTTNVEVNGLVGNVYNQLKRANGGAVNAMNEVSGSVTIYPTRKGGDWWDNGQYMQLFMHTYTNMTSACKDAWNDAMTAIGTCNANLTVVDASTLSDKVQKAAEIRGVRAYWYYMLCDFFGNVPMVTDYNDKTLPANSTRAEVFNWIEKEVKEIIPALPESTHANYGRFTKGAGYTLLAKLYLNSEAWGLGDKSADAVAACESVYAGSDYVLESNWKTNFQVNNEASKEAILSAQYSNTDTQLQNQMHFRTLGYVENKAMMGNFGGWNGFCAQPDYVNLFYNADGTEDPRISSFRMGMQLDANTGEILMTGHNYPMDHYKEVYPLYGTERDGTVWAEVAQQDGARVGKWEYEVGLSDAMENDFHIFRLADVYLMHAEALLRSGGDAAKALELVNAVRSRAYGDASHNYTAIDLDKVQLERRLEFAWEGMSRQDDIRFGCYDKDMWSLLRAETSQELDKAGKPKTIKLNAKQWNRSSSEHLKLYPIPFTAWQTNPNLKQNPGYPAFN